MKPSEFVAARQRQLAAREAYDKFSQENEKMINDAVMSLRAQLERTLRDARDSVVDLVEERRLRDEMRAANKAYDEAYDAHFRCCKHVDDDDKSVLVEGSSFGSPSGFVFCPVCGRSWSN